MQRWACGMVLAAVAWMGCTNAAQSNGSSSTSSSSGGSPDAAMAVDVDAGVPGCDGSPCDTVTNLTATFGGNTITLSRAQVGLEPSDAGLLFYLEAHAGGDPACPTMDSPTPDQTLVLAGIPVRPAGTVLTKADGLGGALLDFTGMFLTDPRPARAVDVELTVRQQNTSPSSNAFLSFDLVAHFDGGIIQGRGNALHCDSLDSP